MERTPYEAEGKQWQVSGEAYDPQRSTFSLTRGRYVRSDPAAWPTSGGLGTDYFFFRRPGTYKVTARLALREQVGGQVRRFSQALTVIVAVHKPKVRLLPIPGSSEYVEGGSAVLAHGPEEAQPGFELKGRVDLWGRFLVGDPYYAPLQLCRLRRTDWAGPGETYTTSTPLVLDDRLPYGLPSSALNNPRNKNFLPRVMDDSPYHGFRSGTLRYDINDDFVCYVIFRRTTRSAWVPLAGVAWGWLASSSRTAPNNWQPLPPGRVWLGAINYDPQPPAWEDWFNSGNDDSGQVNLGGGWW